MSPPHPPRDPPPQISVFKWAYSAARCSVFLWEYRCFAGGVAAEYHRKPEQQPSAERRHGRGKGKRGRAAERYSADEEETVTRVLEVFFIFVVLPRVVLLLMLLLNDDNGANAAAAAAAPGRAAAKEIDFLLVPTLSPGLCVWIVGGFLPRRQAVVSDKMAVVRQSTDVHVCTPPYYPFPCACFALFWVLSSPRPYCRRMKIYEISPPPPPPHPPPITHHPPPRPRRPCGACIAWTSSTPSSVPARWS